MGRYAEHIQEQVMSKCYMMCGKRRRNSYRKSGSEGRVDNDKYQLQQPRSLLDNEIKIKDENECHVKRKSLQKIRVEAWRNVGTSENNI